MADSRCYLFNLNPWFQSVVTMLHIQDSYTGLNSILLDMTGLKVSDFNAIAESLMQFGLLDDKDFGAIDGSELPQPMLLNLLTKQLHSREQLIEPLLQGANNLDQNRTTDSLLSRCWQRKTNVNNHKPQWALSALTNLKGIHYDYICIEYAQGHRSS